MLCAYKTKPKGKVVNKSKSSSLNLWNGATEYTKRKETIGLNRKPKIYVTKYELLHMDFCHCIASQTF